MDTNRFLKVAAIAALAFATSLIAGAQTPTTFAGVKISAADPRLQFNETDQAANLKLWDFDVTAGALTGRTRTDADGAGQNWLAVTRGTTTAIASLVWGNGTDNPSYTFLGTGATTFGGAINVASCTGCGAGVTQTTSSFMATWATACTTDPVQTWEYVQTGNTVTLNSDDLISCTSDSTNFLATGAVPVGIRPLHDVHFVMVSGTDNSIQIPICLFVLANGDMRALPWANDGRCGVVIWTNTGGKSLNFGSGSYASDTFTYTLN